jgi:hypothetical protein
MRHTHLHLSTPLIRTTPKHSNALSDVGVLPLLACFKEFTKVSFSSENFIVPSAIQECKQRKYYNYKFACCFVWVLNLVFHFTGRTQTEGAQEQGAEGSSYS